jgi:hypothetical protein
MKHSVSHGLGRETARKVARSAFDSYSKRFSEFSPRTVWRGDDQAEISFSVKGFTLKGAVEVKEHSIELDMDVPFILKPFQHKAVTVIEREIKDWIKKAEDGAL